MAKDLEAALSQATLQILDSQTFVRAVLSGRRRNMEPEFERIDIRPVLIKAKILLQIVEFDGRKDFTNNLEIHDVNIDQLLKSGFANILVEHTKGSLSIRITKKSEALIHESTGVFTQDLQHDRTKLRLLEASDPFLIEVGISDAAGKIKASKQDKYKQVDEFLRLLTPALTSAIDAGQIHKDSQSNPLRIVDLGCGNAYLTFATHQFLRAQGKSVQVTGIDNRAEFAKRNSTIAVKLGISKSISFHTSDIATMPAQSVDLVIALHACDVATDDAIAWGINNGAKLFLIAPCCHHDLQTQMSVIPEPWSIVTKSGLMKERLGDLLTDSLRSQLLRIAGYRVEAIEFIGDDHTPRNLMIRAVKTDAKADAPILAQYREMCEMWGVIPALEKKLAIPLIS